MSLNNWCPNNKAHLSSGILQNKKDKKNFFSQIFFPEVYNISFLDKDDHNSCVCKFCLFFRKQCFACITFYFCKYFWRKQIVFLYCCWWKKKATVGLKNSKWKVQFWEGFFKDIYCLKSFKMKGEEILSKALLLKISTHYKLPYISFDFSLL